MIKVFLTVSAGVMMLMTASVNAAPISAPGRSGDPAIVQVSGGCGPGGFRAENGRCYPRRPPPRQVYGRECPPGLHITPYGCRRNF